MARQPTWNTLIVFWRRTQMFTLRQPYRVLCVLGMALCPAASFGQASALPNKPVYFIVPTAAAGASDLAGRIVAPKLSEALRQNVIVENRPGANG
jgi:tripartite-type tricarboxylate transporter receptor subunit TctC